MSEAGRPETSPEEIDVIFRKLEPHLKTGLSVYKACLAAQVPKSTVYDLMAKNELFSEKVEATRNYLSITTSNLHLRIIERIKKKLEGNQDITEQEINHLKWFSQISKLTRDEFGERKEIEVFDPQSEIQKLLRKIDERHKLANSDTGGQQS